MRLKPLYKISAIRPILQSDLIFIFGADEVRLMIIFLLIKVICSMQYELLNLNRDNSVQHSSIQTMKQLF